MSQTIKILTRADVESIVAEMIGKRLNAISKEIMDKMEYRIPEAGPKILTDSDGIEMLACTVRLHNFLSRQGMKTIGDIRARSWNWFWCKPGFGKGNLIEFKTRLAANGIKLQD